VPADGVEGGGWNTGGPSGAFGEGEGEGDGGAGGEDDGGAGGDGDGDGDGEGDGVGRGGSVTSGDACGVGGDGVDGDGSNEGGGDGGEDARSAQPPRSAHAVSLASPQSLVGVHHAPAWQTRSPGQSAALAQA